MTPKVSKIGAYQFLPFKRAWKAFSKTSWPPRATNSIFWKSGVIFPPSGSPTGRRSNGSFFPTESSSWQRGTPLATSAGNRMSSLRPANWWSWPPERSSTTMPMNEQLRPKSFGDGCMLFLALMIFGAFPALFLAGGGYFLYRNHRALSWPAIPIVIQGSQAKSTYYEDSETSDLFGRVFHHIRREFSRAGGAGNVYP